MIEFTTTSHQGFVFIEFLLAQNVEPALLKTIAPPDLILQNFAHLGVVLSGRGPVWLYGFLVHFYHPTLWVATHDPRLQGAVVVASHTPTIKPGDIIKLDIGN